MIKNIIFDMGNVLLRFDKDYFLDAVGVQGADRKLLMNNVYLSLEWAKMDRGSMTEAEAAAETAEAAAAGEADLEEAKAQLAETEAVETVETVETAEETAEAPAAEEKE